MEDFITYYELLEVAESATYEEIASAYNSLLHQYHPDKVPEHLKRLKKDAEEKTRLIIDAWKALSDPEKRRQYDEGLKERRRQANDTQGYSAPPRRTRRGSPPPPQPPPPPPAATLIVSESEFHFTNLGLNERAVGTFMISSSCGGYLQADVVSSDPWLRVSQSHVTSLDGRHEIEFDVDTPNLRPYEQYSGEIRVHTNIGSREIPVTVLIEFKQLEDISRYGGRILSGFLKDNLHRWHIGPDSPKRKLTSVPPWALILALLFHEDEPQSAVGKRDGKTISLFGVAMALIVLVGIIAIVAMFMARSGQ